jgi:hypothetical protein
VRELLGTCRASSPLQCVRPSVVCLRLLRARNALRHCRAASARRKEVRRAVRGPGPGSDNGPSRDGTCGTREGPRRGVVFTVAFRDCRARVTVTECRLESRVLFRASFFRSRERSRRRRSLCVTGDRRGTRVAARSCDVPRPRSGLRSPVCSAVSPVSCERRDQRPE